MNERKKRAIANPEIDTAAAQNIYTIDFRRRNIVHSYF